MKKRSYLCCLEEPHHAMGLASKPYFWFCEGTRVPHGRNTKEKKQARNINMDQATTEYLLTWMGSMGDQ
jgi:hypothetical protein